MRGASSNYENLCLGYEVITVDGTVKTPSPPAATRVAYIFFRGANTRITFHGVDPTSSFGVPFYDGYENEYAMREVVNMRMTREGSTNGEVHLVYYK